MKYRSRALALLLAALCGAAMLTGCQKNKITPEEELPYGATMRSSTAYAVPITYDRRFMEDAQVVAVTDFLGAIEQSDGTVLERVTFPVYLSYELGEVYSDKCKDADDLAAVKHDAMADSYGSDFSFKEVNITEMTQEQQRSGIAAMLSILYQLSDDEQLAEKIENTWALTMEWTVQSSTGTELVQDRTLYLLEMDGTYYCIM